MSQDNTRSLALEKGTILEDYRIENELGKGGFAITYLATDIRLDKKVAIKELLPDGIATRLQGNTVVPQTQSQAGDFRWAVDSFLQEAKTLASFEHPNIVNVLRLFEANETAYIVMPLIQGHTLKNIISKEGPLPYERVHGVLASLLDGLKLVHAAGVLHRDIKPENIFLTDLGMPVLIDFGAARQQVTGKSEAITSIITPGYAPIEQYSIDSKYQGPWSDIYAMAAVVYHLVTGDKPAAASDRSDAMRNGQSDPVTPLAQIVPPGYPPKFLTAVDSALAMNERERPADIMTWLMMLGDPPSISAVHTSTAHNIPPAPSAPSAAPSVPSAYGPQGNAGLSEKKNIMPLVAVVTVLVLLLGGVGAYFAFNKDGDKKGSGDSAAVAQNPASGAGDTVNTVDLESAKNQANQFLQNYGGDFWHGRDAWYLSDYRLSDRFAMAVRKAMERVINEGVSYDPFTDREGDAIYRLADVPVTAKDVVAGSHANQAVITLNDQTDKGIKLVMVKSEGKWLVDGRLGGTRSFDPSSYDQLTSQHKNLLASARSRGRNLVNLALDKKSNLRGTIAMVRVKDEGGNSWTEPYLKLNNHYLRVDLTDDERKSIDSIDQYYGQIPLSFSGNGDYINKQLVAMQGKSVSLNGELSLLGGSDTVMPIEFFVEDIHRQLGISKPASEQPSKVASPFLFPDSHRRMLRQTELLRLNKDQLWRARNEMYARRGYIFVSSRGKALAASLGAFYSPRSADYDVIAASMNNIEQSNLAAIKLIEKNGGAPSNNTNSSMHPPGGGGVLRGRLHHAIASNASKVYMGKYGGKSAIYSIQWLPDETFRGSIFLYQEGKELNIYGTNYVQGEIQLEIWQGGKFLVKAKMGKERYGSQLMWNGYTQNSQRTRLQFARQTQRSSTSVFNSSYLGRVGSSVIDVSLVWLADGTVNGNYRSRATGSTYILKGDNTVAGFLYLDEMTNGNLSARVLLIKKNIQGRVHWQGSLFNTDGRVKHISFTKK